MSSWQNKVLKCVMRLNRLAVEFDREVKVKKWRRMIEQLAYVISFPSGMKEEKLFVEQMPAEWIYSNDCKDENGPIILFIHGGGYFMGTIYCYRGLAARIAKAAKGKLLIFDYSLGPEHPFPAAVEDAISAYRWLLKQRIDPKRIVIAGDSAGGGLTLAALAALRDGGDPMPACAVCLSPWTDLALTGESMQSKAKEDVIFTPRLFALAAPLYLNDIDPKTPLASPLYADLRGLPPLLIQVGSAELLLSDSTRLAERAKAAGVDVTFEIWEDMFHVFQMFAQYLPEGKQAFEKIGGFVRSHTANPF